MMLAMDAQGKQITTVEGIANGDNLHPVQEAFIKHDAMMCGFCTPGFIVSSVALLNDNKKPTLTEIKEGLSGNTCRCGTYPFIFDAVETASEKI
jgi:aerobic-type carbon monoxide dehydrogenase small subunit (CoxS/CutS family)